MNKRIRIQSHLSFRARLVILAIASLVYVALLVYLSAHHLFENTQQHRQAFVQVAAKTAQIARIFTELDKIISVEKQELQTALVPEGKDRVTPRRINYGILEQDIANLKKLLDHPDELDLLQTIRRLINDQKNIHLRINSLIVQNHPEKAALLDIHQLEKNRNEIRIKLQTLLNLAQEQLSKLAEQSDQAASRSVAWIVIASGTYALLIVLFQLLVARQMRDNTATSQHFLQQLNQGIVPVEELPEPYNEVGTLNQQVNQLAQYHRRIRQYIQTLLNESDTEFRLVSENDKIGHLLNTLNDKNRQILAQQAQSLQSHTYSEWVFNGIKLFNDILTKLAPSIDALADKVILALVDYLKLPLAGFYAMQEDDNGPYLRLVATYAYEQRKLYQRRVEIGEGLVGAVVIEKQLSFHANIPDDYFVITSGMGKAQPKKLMIVPLIHTDSVVGVIELATFSDFEQKYIDFIRQIAPNIAVTVSTVEANERNFQLLSDNKQTIARLHEREAKLRHELEQAVLQTTELQQSEAELQRYLRAVDAHVVIVELGTQSEILGFNSKFLELSKFDELSLKKSKFPKFIHNLDEITLFKDGRPVQKAGLQKVVLTSQALDEIPLLASLNWSTVYHNRVFFIGLEIREFESNNRKTIELAKNLRAQLEQAERELAYLRSEKEIANGIESANKQILEALDPVIAYARFDLGWTLQYYNPRFLQETNANEGQLRQLNLREVIPSDFTDRLQQIEASLLQGNTHRTITPLRFGFGPNEEWFQIDYIPVAPSNKEVSYFYLRFQNVAKLHRAELILEQSFQENTQLKQQLSEYTKRLQRLEELEHQQAHYKILLKEHEQLRQQAVSVLDLQEQVKAKDLLLHEEIRRVEHLGQEAKRNEDKLRQRVQQLETDLQNLRLEYHELGLEKNTIEIELFDLLQQQNRTLEDLTETEKEIERYKDQQNKQQAQSSENLRQWIEQLKHFLDERP